MIPDDYDSFHCLADRCPDTCCRGWRISIDEASLKKYAKMKGLIGNRLRKSVDWHNGIFRLYRGKCVLLEDGLCGLQLEADTRPGRLFDQGRRDGGSLRRVCLFAHQIELGAARDPVGRGGGLFIGSGRGGGSKIRFFLL